MASPSVRLTADIIACCARPHGLAARPFHSLPCDRSAGEIAATSSAGSAAAAEANANAFEDGACCGQQRQPMSGRSIVEVAIRRRPVSEFATISTLKLVL